MRDLIDEIARLAKEHSVEKVVIGMPVRTDGEERGFAEKVREFGDSIAGSLQLEVVFWDERFSTQEAERAMREADLDARKMRGKIDSVSASLILQTYLDYVRESE